MSSLMQIDEEFEDIYNNWKEEQTELKTRLILKDTKPWQQDFVTLQYVGGVDVSFVKTSTTLACASLVVCSFPDLEVVYSDCELVHLDTPYIPGFLAFREVGFFLDLLDRLKEKSPNLMPQVIFVDGNGILHPRGFGIASHLGVLSDTPSVGVAKTLMQVDGIAKDQQFTAKVAELKNGGDTFPLATDSGQVLGMALRGCNKSTNPIYVSAGHQISLQTAVKLCRQCCRYRVAEPVRQADIRSREFLRERYPETVRTGIKPGAKATRGTDDRHTDKRAPGIQQASQSQAGGGGSKRAMCFLYEDQSQDSEEEEMVFSSLFGSG